MAPGGAAPGTDVVDVETVLDSVSAEPTNRALGILDGGGKGGHVTQSVVDADAQESGASQQANPARVFVTAAPTATVDKDHRWGGVGRPLIREIEVQQEGDIPAATELEASHDAVSVRRHWRWRLIGAGGRRLGFSNGRFWGDSHSVFLWHHEVREYRCRDGISRR
jgi:hypothetical protein